MLCTATWNSIREYAGLALRIHQYPIHRSISFIQCLPDEVQFPLYLCKVQPIKWQQTVRLKDVHTEALEVSRASSGSVGAASREECRASHDCSSFFGMATLGCPAARMGLKSSSTPMSKLNSTKSSSIAASSTQSSTLSWETLPSNSGSSFGFFCVQWSVVATILF